MRTAAIATALLVGGMITGPAATAAPVTSGSDCVQSHAPGNGYTAPAPTKNDANGTKDDQFYIPEHNFMHPQKADGRYLVNGKGVEKGWHRLASGVESVTITTDFDSGSWTFCYTPDFLAEEAPNSYRAQRFRCDPLTGRTPVSVFVTNTDEGAGTTIRETHVVPERPADDIPTGVFSDYDIQEGETREIGINVRSGNRTYGLPPGNWMLPVYHDRNQRNLAKRLRVTIPSPCGEATAPGSGGGGGGGVTPPVGPTAGQPRGSLAQVSRTMKMRAMMDNRAGRRTAYQLKVDPLRGTTVTKRYGVAAKTKRTVTYGNPAKAKKGTVYVLKAQVKKNGKLAWQTLARRTAR